MTAAYRFEIQNSHRSELLQERQPLLYELTDTVTNAADGILGEVEKMGRGMEEKDKTHGA